MKINVLATSIILFFSFSASSTSIKERTLAELMLEADHVIIGTIELVNMFDESSKEITDLNARTGPGISNVIYLHLNIENTGILKTNSTRKLDELTIPLWTEWHYSLKDWKEYQNGEYIFLLKGESFEKVYPSYFMRNLSDKEEIISLLGKSQNKAKQ